MELTREGSCIIRTFAGGGTGVTSPKWRTQHIPRAQMPVRKDVPEETKEQLRVSCAVLDTTTLLHEIFLPRGCFSRALFPNARGALVSEGCIGQDHLDEITKRRRPLVIRRRDARSLLVPESDMVGQNRLHQLWVIHRTHYLEILLPVGEDFMCRQVEGGILWVSSGHLKQLPFRHADHDAPYVRPVDRSRAHDAGLCSDVDAAGGKKIA